MGHFTMPSLGSDMEAGELVEWLVEPGQTVSKGDIMAVVETQKGAIDIETYEDGVVEALVVQVGEKVPVGTLLARMQGGGDEGVSTPTVATQGEKPDPAPAADPVVPRTEGPRASPRARRLARELGVDLAQIEGTGAGGAITGEDIERAATGPSKDPRKEMRRAIAAAMSRANAEIPHYYLGQTLDLERMVQWLSAENTRRSVADRLLPVVPVLKAMALALHEVPEINGFWRESFEPATEINLGMAISLRGGGLVAPAIRGVDHRSLSEIMQSLRDVVTRARKGELRSSDMSGATITVTNLGDRGVESVYGVIYPPQVALLGLGTIAQRPVVVDGELAVHHTVHLSLAADHRASDGHRGGLFIKAVDKFLQEPEKLA